MLIRACPRCGSERALDEFYCQGTFDDQVCSWDLTSVQPTQHGVLPTSSPSTAAPLRCSNGHLVSSGDLACPECGADLSTTGDDTVPPEDGPQQPDLINETVISGWHLIERLNPESSTNELYKARHRQDGREAALTLYPVGAELDSEVYAVLRNRDIEHIPEIYEIGHWNGRAFEAREVMTGGNLETFDVDPQDIGLIRRIVDEIGRALDDFSNVGLRHRNLRPSAVLIRDPVNLDLVITGFGSARLSEFDLDIVSPLETTRYMAPEAVAGGVAAASDWWSLGMIVLEKATRGRCFEGIAEQAFIIQVLAGGVPLPDDLDSDIRLLLRGLLARDRLKRWRWKEVRAWLDGQLPEAPEMEGDLGEGTGPALTLGGVDHRRATRYALAAAEATNWDEARDQLLRGRLTSWVEETGIDPRRLSTLRSLGSREVDDDTRLSIALKILNPDMPLVRRGEIITPGWLMQNPVDGYALISGEAPDILSRLEAEAWLSQLKRRAAAVRERARFHEIELNEAQLRILLLSSSRARLAALAEEHRKLFPDTNHSGLVAIMDRRQVTDEDLIILLAAVVTQYRAIDDVISEARTLAKESGLTDFDEERVRIDLATNSRRTLFRLVDERIENFGQCETSQVNEWATQFRLDRRAPVARALVILSVPKERWRPLPNQGYVGHLLSFFEQKLSSTITRGPLARMSVTRTGHRIDLFELGTERRPSESMLHQLLQRMNYAIELDPALFAADATLEARLRTLERNASLYKRDTGIDALYLGFPFLLFQTSGVAKPRIAPVLLWPIRVSSEVGQRGLFRLSFDEGRERVRLNPALEGFLGPEPRAQWKAATDAALGRHATIKDIIDEFGQLAPPRGHDLVRLPGLDTKVQIGPGELVCAAVLFNAAFAGLGLLKDLQQLPMLGREGTALESMLRLVRGERTKESSDKTTESDKYFTAATDPSQEAAVLRSREAPGIVVSGPPGTGKSQTIVNIVGDAIGRKKSLLVVCQKQAALNVVHKRLVKEGLGDRIALVNDINSDRRGIISAVREQLEAVRQKANEINRVRASRQALAKRIESIESALDTHHQSIHRKDPVTGRSYRDLVGELVALESKAKIRAHMLQRQVGKMPPDRLAEIEEACAPLVRYWLAADPEKSPLAALKEFGWDEITVETFERDFEDFAAAEEARVKLPSLGPLGSELNDPSAVRQWIASFAEHLKSMQPQVRANLARWYDRFCPNGGRVAPGKEARQALGIVHDRLKKLDGSSHDDNLHKVVLHLDDVALAQWVGVAEAATQVSGFFGFLNLTRLVRRRRLRRFLAISNQGQSDVRMVAFLAAALLERALREPRLLVSEVARMLGEGSDGIDRMPLAVLRRKVDEIARALDSVVPFADAIAACPWRASAESAAKSGKQEDISALLNALELALLRHSARERSLRSLEKLHEWFRSEWLEPQIRRVKENAGIDVGIQAIRNEFLKLPKYQLFRARSRDLEPEARAVLASLYPVRSDLEALSAEELEWEFRRILNSEARRFWIARQEQSEPTLLMERDEITTKVKALADADQEMRQLNRQTLIHDIDVSKLGKAGAWEDITRLQGARARGLRDFVDLGTRLGLMQLRPVWLTNPDVASELFPLKPGMFDLLVYDEASQMPVEHAVPTLYRGKVIVVSGDDKQLPPTSFFTSKVESDEAEIFDGDVPDEGASEDDLNVVEEAWNRREIKDCPDLLSLARAILPESTLEIHYRSEFRELIQFSNASFYGNRLNVPVRHPENVVRATRPLEVVRVDGAYEHQTNDAEAQRVAQLVAEQWANAPAARPSIGIVTFNRKQADLIEEKLEELAERDSAFQATYRQELNRSDGGEDMSLFVKNVENVQGDERDLMIFSTTFGRNTQGTFRRFFGVLGQKGGERRLNVAITRAREKVILVTSLPITDISDMLTTRRPPAKPRDYLQAYLRYAECLSAGDLDAARLQLQQMTLNTALDLRDGFAKEDGFGRAIAAFIAELGHLTVSSGDGTAFGIDYAIQHPRTGLFGIGIECDSPRHELLGAARAREIWRLAVLRKSIPIVHRVSSHGWYHDREAEKRRLTAAISAALI